jgi:hypothetical protein
MMELRDDQASTIVYIGNEKFRITENDSIRERVFHELIYTLANNESYRFPFGCLHLIHELQPGSQYIEESIEGLKEIICQLYAIGDAMVPAGELACLLQRQLLKSDDSSNQHILDCFDFQLRLLRHDPYFAPFVDDVLYYGILIPHVSMKTLENLLTVVSVCVNGYRSERSADFIEMCSFVIRQFDPYVMYSNPLNKSFNLFYDLIARQANTGKEMKILLDMYIGSQESSMSKLQMLPTELFRELKKFLI